MLPGFNVGPGLMGGNSGLITFVGQTSGGGFSPPASVAISSGLTGGSGSAAQGGDFVLVIGSDMSGSDVTFSLAGYTKIADLYVNGTGNDPNMAVFWKFMPSTPDTTVLMPTGATSVLVSVWRGVDPTTPIDATTTTGSSTSSLNADGPAITTVTPNAVVVSAAEITANTGSPPAPPSGYTLMSVNGFSDRAVTAYKTVTAPGAENPGAWTGLSGGNNSYVVATIALRPET